MFAGQAAAAAAAAAAHSWGFQLLAFPEHPWLGALPQLVFLMVT
jgi:hypothetical protein